VLKIVCQALNVSRHDFKRPCRAEEHEEAAMENMLETFTHQLVAEVDERITTVLMPPASCGNIQVVVLISEPCMVKLPHQVRWHVLPRKMANHERSDMTFLALWKRLGSPDWHIFAQVIPICVHLSGVEDFILQLVEGF